MKKQKRKIGVAGCFQNQLMGNNSTTPMVGEGATILLYSDREAYEVISVSDDENSCVIREVNAKFIGKSYGDERYEYSSDPDGVTRRLEWNHKKKCWGSIWYSIQIIKSLEKEYYKKYGYGWNKILLADRGLTRDDITSKEGGYKLIEGLTKRYKNFSRVSIIFGIMEQYRDPHF